MTIQNTSAAQISIQALAVEVSGTLFARASVIDRGILLSAIDVSASDSGSFAAARDEAIRLALDCSGCTVSEGTTPQEPASPASAGIVPIAAAAVDAPLDAAASQPNVSDADRDNQEQMKPDDVQVGYAEESPEATKESDSEELLIVGYPASDKTVTVEPEQESRAEEASASEEAVPPTEVDSAESVAPAEEPGKTGVEDALEAALSTKFAIKEGLANKSVEPFIGQELRILLKLKPSMLRLLAKRRDSILTDETRDAIKLINSSIEKGKA